MEIFMFNLANWVPSRTGTWLPSGSGTLQTAPSSLLLVVVGLYERRKRRRRIPDDSLFVGAEIPRQSYICKGLHWSLSASTVLMLAATTIHEALLAQPISLLSVHCSSCTALRASVCAFAANTGSDGWCMWGPRSLWSLYKHTYIYDNKSWNRTRRKTSA